MPLARRLLLIALPFTLFVIVVGAYVRLTDAGLGCPDWPGCYGKLLGVADEQTAAERYPNSPYDLRKAWIEVSHRIIAALLGLLLLAAAAADWRANRRLSLTLCLPLLVAAQGLLGMLTVTEKLQPAIVVSHLAGGLTILACITVAVTRRPLSAAPSASARRALLRWWRAAALLLAVQIILGGWVSASYAGLACPQFPQCQSGWLPPQLDFSGYDVTRPLHQHADGSPLSAAALATIHWLHRAMALAVAAVFAAFIFRLVSAGARGEGIGLGLFLCLQIALGIVNVLWQLPLWAAVAHNALAALLVVNIAVIGVKLHCTAAAAPPAPA